MSNLITIHAGDFSSAPSKAVYGRLSFTGRSLILPVRGGWSWQEEKIPLDHLEEVTAASEESVKKFGGALGMALLGSLLGPAGFVAGALVGGNKKQVTFTARLQDGREFLATTDNKTFLQLQAAVFTRRHTHDTRQLPPAVA